MFWSSDGIPLIIEFKRKGEKPSKLQRYILKQLSDRNYEARWTDSKVEAIEWLENW